jgi:hypothetical protein
LTKGKDAAQNQVQFPNPSHESDIKMALRDPKPTGKMTLEAAQSLAISALTYLSSTPDLMQRFLALSGIEASHIREAAREPHFFAGVLRFFTAHEPTLLAYCEATDTPPQSIQAALNALPGGSDMSQ